MRISVAMAFLAFMCSLMSFSQSDNEVAHALKKCILSNMNGKSIDALEAANESCQTELNQWFDLCKDRLNICPKEVRYACTDPTLGEKCLSEKQRILDDATSVWEMTHQPSPKPAVPQFVAVTAQGVSIVPGAIVCPSHAAVSIIFDRYISHWEGATQDALTNGQSRLIRGTSAPAPNLKSLGCALIPPGTPMTLNTRNVVPIVTAKLPNGTTIRGVTLPAMFRENQKTLGKDAFPAALQSSKIQQPPIESSQKPSKTEQTIPPPFQPQVSQLTTPTPVEKPNHPIEHPSIAQIDQNATALWNQKRYTEAIPLFDQTCAAGNANSCYRIGLIYDFGAGVAQDLNRAELFYSKSCNAGNGTACYHLGTLRDYLPGNESCKTSTLSVMEGKDCDANSAMSCETLGYRFTYGCGVVRDRERGRQLLAKGCSLGYERACDGPK